MHVAIRFSDDLYSIGDTIGRHREILARSGAVWLGKFGKPLAAKRIELINEQVAAETPSYLYLVRKRPRSAGYDSFRGGILKMSRDEDDVEQKLVPGYYDRLNLWGLVGFWVKLSTLDPLPPDGLKHLRVLRSNMPLTDSLRSSVAGMFIVGRQNHPSR